MQEIADWLKRLGLPEYAGAFAENGIDVAVLPHLTDQDLKDIGVLLGHRRKILAAVAELPGKSPSASKPFPPVVEARDRHTTEPPQVASSSCRHAFPKIGR
jgi:SAM domain (Sterile alpha motif)